MNGSMARGLKSSLQSWLTRLCVALSIVFAGTSAASVVDRAQHAAYAPHEHAVGLASEDADPPQHNDGADHADLDQAAKDHPFGPGHHHADGPTGFMSGVEAALVATSIEDALAPIPADAGVSGLWPRGLERPPKAIAVNV